MLHWHLLSRQMKVRARRFKYWSSAVATLVPGDRVESVWMTCQKGCTEQRMRTIQMTSRHLSRRRRVHNCWSPLLWHVINRFQHFRRHHSTRSLGWESNMVIFRHQVHFDTFRNASAGSIKQRLGMHSTPVGDGIINNHMRIKK